MAYGGGYLQLWGVWFCVVCGRGVGVQERNEQVKNRQIALKKNDLNNDDIMFKSEAIANSGWIQQCID